MNDNEELPVFLPSAGEAGKLGKNSLVQLARMILERNRRRGQYLSGMAWGEPGWDILLDLYVAAADELPTSIAAIARRQKLSGILCRRYLVMLSNSGHVINGDRNWHGSDYLLRPEAEQAIEAWLRDCFREL